MITSTANLYVKYIRSLVARKRERDRERSFVIEGVRLTGQALASGVSPSLVLYAPDQLAATAGGHALLEQLASNPVAHQATARVVAAAADTVNPQGIVAVVPHPSPPTFLPSPPSGASPGLSLILDAIQDPGNVGTLLRSAEAVGIGQVWCTRGTADVYSPKVVRAAMGAHFSLVILEEGEWESLGRLLAEVPRIYAATAAVEGAQPYDVVDWSLPATLIVGSEGHGISAAGLALATERVAIPMVGHLTSLNAAVAGSIILFEALRQQRTAQASNKPAS